MKGVANAGSMKMGARKLRVLHLSCDFPDPLVPSKTPVIRTLLDLTSSEFDHDVISLNREKMGAVALAQALLRGGGRLQLRMSGERFAYGKALRYWAPDKGLYLQTLMRQLGAEVASMVQARTARPDLLVAHKLSVEGLAVQHAAEILGLPYAISIQGDTDTKVLAARPDLRAAHRRVFLDAALVFPFAPWALDKVTSKLGKRSGPVQLLPCPTDLDRPVPPISGGVGLVTTFHLKNQARKNLPGMVEAIRVLARRGIDANLGVVGGGSEADIALCRSVIGACASVRLEGPLDRGALRARLGQARAFVCPSLRESFGLVFIEALFAGVPVIYPRGTAIDGYFDGQPFAIAVDPRNPEAIANAMQHVLEHESELKIALAGWQTSGAAKVFQRAHIARSFANGLRQAAVAGGEETGNAGRALGEVDR